MDETIAAIYENGVLRPLTPLALPEHAEVQISIKTLPPRTEARHLVIQTLVAAGLVAPTSGALPAIPLSEEERRELARRIPTGRPLSEIIIEEREGR